jgi:hypothetical protein
MCRIQDHIQIKGLFIGKFKGGPWHIVGIFDRFWYRRERAKGFVWGPADHEESLYINFPRDSIESGMFCSKSYPRVHICPVPILVEGNTPAHIIVCSLL